MDRLASTLVVVGLIGAIVVITTTVTVQFGMGAATLIAAALTAGVTGGIGLGKLLGRKKEREHARRLKQGKVRMLAAASVEATPVVRLSEVELEAAHDLIVDGKLEIREGMLCNPRAETEVVPEIGGDERAGQEALPGDVFRTPALPEGVADEPPNVVVNSAERLKSLDDSCTQLEERCEALQQAIMGAHLGLQAGAVAVLMHRIVTSAESVQAQLRGGWIETPYGEEIRGGDGHLEKVRRIWKAAAAKGNDTSTLLSRESVESILPSAGEIATLGRQVLSSFSS